MKQVLIAIDQLLNAIHGGWADETISARAWRCRDRKPYSIYVKVIDALFFWDKHHCQNAYFAEATRKQIAPEYRTHD